MEQTAVERLRWYIAARKKMRGVDIEQIHGINVGDESEAYLLLSDIEALCELTAANLALTERVLYAERERDEAKADVHSLRVNETDVNEKVGSQAVLLADLRAELARKDAALERIENETSFWEGGLATSIMEIVKAAREAKGSLTSVNDAEEEAIAGIKRLTSELARKIKATEGK